MNVLLEASDLSDSGVCHLNDVRDLLCVNIAGSEGLQVGRAAGGNIGHDVGESLVCALRLGAHARQPIVDWLDQRIVCACSNDANQVCWVQASVLRRNH